MVIILNLLRYLFISFELCLQEHREKLDLVVCQLGMPEVKDEVDSCGISVIPSLMVKRIVEDNAFVLLKLLRFVSNSHPCALCSQHGQMNS